MRQGYRPAAAIARSQTSSQLCRRHRMAPRTGGTMLPPILEIYVVWHPRDHSGANVAQAMVNHFQGNTFSGLLGGAVEVYVRSTGWRSPDDAPRPIPFPTAASPAPNRPPQPVLTAVVPIIDVELASAVE